MKNFLAAAAFFFAGAAQAQPLYQLTQTIPLPGGTKWDYLHFDSATNRLFVSHGDEVTVVDTQGGKVIGELTGLPGSHGIAIDPATGDIWADSAARRLAVAFDPNTFKPLATVPVVLDADGMAYDPASRQIFNTGGDGMAITPINPATRSAAPDIALGGSPEFLATDGMGSLYDNIEDLNQILRIDTSTDKIIARWPLTTCTHPKGMAVDGPARLVFASCASGVMVVLNADTGALIATLPIGKGTDAAAIDPVRHLAFGSAGDGTLTVVAETPTPHVLGVVRTASGARTMALDPRTGNVFVVTADVAGTIPGEPTHFKFVPGSLHVLVYAPVLHLERVVLLMRHGVRPPTHEPALDPAIAPDAWPKWEVPDGYLTPHGAAAIRILAAYDRKLFAATCADLSIYADVDERTVKTGEAYADGFGCATPVGHAAMADDPLFSALDNGAPGFNAKAAKAAMLAAAGGNIQDVVVNNASLFQAMQAALDPRGSAFLNLPAKISAKLPGHLPKLSGPLSEGASGAEDFLLEYLDDKPMSDVAWGRLNAAGVARLLALHPLEYTITARPAIIAQATAAPLAQRIAAGLASGPKVQILVGHDTNIAELGGLLGLHWSLGGYPADDPPPGGGILFSLLAGPGGTQFVTATYQVQTMDEIRNLTGAAPAMQELAIPDCGEAGACTLADFKKLVAGE
jgi:4-phytase/acid phosphatase